MASLNFLALYYYKAVMKPIGNEKAEIQKTFGAPLKAQLENMLTLYTRSSAQEYNPFNE